MIELLPLTRDNFIHAKASGKLTNEDYDDVISLAEEKIKKYGKTRWLIEIQDFRGWEIKAAIEDIRFDLKHFNDIEKLAIVGNRDWQRWAANLSEVFTGGEVRFFDITERTNALLWMRNSNGAYIRH
ncbi:MAG: STAS/SEC14 domain-containing protein [Pseudohongiellaceae bacterium]